MSVGTHYTKTDWNNRAADLRQRYMVFAALAKEMAADVAPFTDAQLVTLTGFTATEVTDLRSGINVSDALRKVAEGDSTTATVNAAVGVLSLMVGKFGGA